MTIKRMALGIMGLVAAGILALPVAAAAAPAGTASRECDAARSYLQYTVDVYNHDAASGASAARMQADRDRVVDAQNRERAACG